MGTNFGKSIVSKPNHKSHDKVFCYVDSIAKTFKMHIPSAIIRLILQFYYKDILQFRCMKHDETVQIMNNGKLAKKMIFNSGWSSVILSNTIRSEDHFGYFELHIKLEYVNQYLVIGYILNNDTKNHVGLYPQTRYVIANIGYSVIHKYPEHQAYKVSDPVQNGDVFSFCYNFLHNLVSIYHNGRYVGDLTLETQMEVMPAFTFSPYVPPDSEIQILEDYKLPFR